ncbi:MAG TPA: nuclear transport factor 2 family protein [Bryobacteraceae bacterium]|jgi:ketosteroid isomerase-like protein|nr:nuclear transport factor 2 family protein [Bryobacteraceae bacterium]
MHITWLASVALIALSAFGQQTNTDELKQVLAQQQAAWNRGDLEAFMQTYSKSDELTFFSGNTIIHGWRPTLERYRKKYQAEGAQMGILSFTEMQVTMLGPDGAMVTARWHLAMPDGKKREGLTTVICVRSAVSWKIIHDHSS